MQTGTRKGGRDAGAEAARLAKLSEGYKDTPPQRDWLDAKLEEAGIRKTELAVTLQMHPNMVHKLFNGERRPQLYELRVLAKALRLPMAEIIERFGVEVPGRRASCIGAINGDGRVSLYPPHKVRLVHAPEDGTLGLVALVVDAANTALGTYHGNTLFYEPANNVRVDAFGRLAVLELSDEPAPVVGVLDRATLGRGIVRVFGGLETLNANTIVSAAPVHWQRFG